LEVYPVFHEEFGSADARNVPVGEHGVRVLLYPVGQHGVVRLFPGTRDLHVHKHYSMHGGEHLHNLFKLLFAEGAVAADVDDHDLTKLVGVAALAQDVDRSRA
jgi:hypothetical protein